MLTGSLRTHLHYPNLRREVPTAERREILLALNLPRLEDLCGGFVEEFVFEKIPPVGGRQRLAFDRDNEPAIL
jgi:ABC-type uncharacterized transport system fused permease/ATPase subunit